MSSLKHRARRWVALSTAAATAAAAMFDPAMMRSAAAANTAYVYTGPGGTSAAPTSGDWNTATNWVGGVPVSYLDTQLNFGGSGASYTSQDDLSGSFSLNEIVLSASGSNTNTISATTGDSLNFVANDSSTNPSLLQNGSGAFVIAPAINLSNDLTIGGTGLGSVTLSGNISGSGGIIMSGAGTLFLSSGNSYTDPTTFNSGIISVAADSALGATSSSLNFNGGALATTANFTLNAGRAVNLYSGTSSINAASGTTLTYDGTFNNYGGNLNFSGLGTVDLGGPGYGSSTWTVSNGTLAVDFTQAGAPSSNILAGSLILAVNGGTTNFLVPAGASDSQQISQLNIVNGQSNIGATIGSGGALTLQLGSLSRTNPTTSAGTTGAVNFTIATGETIAASASMNDGIIGGWATVGGNSWATINGSGDIVAYSGETTLPTSGTSASTNYVLTSSTTLTGAESVNALRLNGSGATLALGGNNLTFNPASSGGLLAATTSTISGTGTISAGSNNEFIVTVASGATLSVSAPISTGNSSGALTKAGPGTLTQTGLISGGGALNIDSGTFNYNQNGNSPAIGAINVEAGTLQVDSGNSSVVLVNPFGSANTITLGSVGAATLGLWNGGNGTSATYNNPIVIGSGAGASNAAVTINEIAGGSTFSAAVTLPSSGTNTLNLINSNNSGGVLLFTGGVTGTGNLVLQLTGTSANTSSIQFTTTAVNNAGTITNSSTTTSTTTGGIVIGSGLGANVTGLTQNSAAVPMTINTTAGTNFTGSTNVLNGTLTLSIAGALGNSAITVNGTGAILNETVANALNGTSETLNVLSGTANLSQANSFAGGAFISGGTVNASVAGSLGNVSITGGTLSATNSSGAVNTGTISLNGGLLTSGLVGGYGTVAGGSRVNTINPGTVGAYGQLNVVTLNTGSGTVLQFDESTPWSGTPANTGDLLDVTGSSGLTIASGTSLVFANGSPTASGDYRLIEYSGSISGLSNLVLPTPTRSGITYSLSTSVDPGYVDLIVNNGSSAVNGSWIPTAAGTYQWTQSSNWVNGAIPSVSGDSATFAGATGAEIVQLNGQQHLGSVTFNAGSGGSYAISQLNSTDNFSFDNGAGIATLLQQAGNSSITAPVSLLSSTNFNLATGTTFTISGAIDGTGKLTLASGTTAGGTLVLSGSNTFTGGIEVDAGTLATSRTDNLALGNQGVGTVTLNGGTLSYTAGTTQITPTSGFVIVVGANGGTFNNAGSGTTGKVLFSANGELTGSGTLTKTGAADLQMSNPNIGFTGNVIINGLIEDQNMAALGGGGQTPPNSFTVGTGGQLVNSGTLQIFQPITLAGGTLSANGNTNLGIFNDTVNVTANSTLAAAQFQGTTTPQNFAINTLTGSGNLTVTGGSGGSLGMVTLEKASGYTGTITIGTGGALGIGSSTSSNFFGSSNAISVSTTSSAIGLVADGDGTSSVQTLQFTLPSNAINFVSGNTGGYVVGKAGGTTYFNTEANKIIAVQGTLPLNNPTGNTLNVTPLNGYGLELDPVLTATTTYNVGGTQPSNVVPGLILTNLTGAYGIVKTGTGTLQLGTGPGDTSNTFGGSGDLIDIQGGRVSAFSDAGLGNSANVIKLDSTTNTPTFTALASFSLLHTLELAQTPGTVEVAAGQTLTLTDILQIDAAADVLNKADLGTLVMDNSVTGSGSSWTGGLTINEGAVQLTASTGSAGNGLPSTTPININNNAVANVGGAALQLVAGSGNSITITNAINLNPSASNTAGGGINNGGALENVSGNNIVSGTVSLSADSMVGADSGSTLTFSGGALGMATATTRFLGFNTQGTGVINLAESMGTAPTTTAFYTINKVGTGTLNITAAQTISATGGTAALGNGDLAIAGGLVDVSGAGTLSGTYTNGLSIAYGSTLTLDNTGNNVTNRLGNATNLVEFYGSGTLNLLGNSGSTSSETFKSISFGRGEDVMDAVANGGGQANITLTSGGTFTHNTLSSVVFEGTGLTSSDAVGSGNGTFTIGSAAATFQGAAQQTGGYANQAILPWALAENSSNSSYTLATSSTTTGVIRQMASNEANSSVVASYGYAGSGIGTATFTSGSTNVTITGSTSSLFLGEAVTGTGIAAGSYISAIGTGSYTLSTAATASGSGDLLYSTGADNVNVTNAAKGPTAALTQTINSLTLGSGGSLTLGPSVQTITLGGAQGGAILSLDTVNGNTISGGIITAGANELDVHTVGNLTISSAITGGGGTGAVVGLTKGENGTLTLASNAFYFGETAINAGTLNLNAGVNTIQYGNYLEVGPTATVNLNGNSQIITGLFDDANIGSGAGDFGAGGTITGTTGATLALNQDNNAHAWFGNISGSVNLVRSGQNTWYVDAPQSTSGNVILNGGTTTLRDTGSFTGLNSLAIDQATLILDNNGGTTDSSTRLPSGLGISLDGATISYIGRAQYTSAETLGTLTAAMGASTISITQQTSGISTATLTLSGLTRNTGSTVNFTNTNGTLGTIGSNPQILLLNNNSLTDNILGGGFVVNGSDWASYNSSFGVGGLSTTGYAGYSPDLITSAVAADNISMSTTPAANLNNTTINSLRVTGTSAVTFNSGQGLTLTSGGLLINGSLTLGNAANNGTLTSGGPELFLYVNAGTDVINSVITGSNAVVKSGGTALTLAGTNTYTGGTYVDQSTLTLAATGTLGTGGIFLNGGTLVQTSGGIIPSQAVSLTGAGVLTLAGANTLTSLTFNNNGGTTAPSITTTGGILTLTSGSITASSSNVGTTSAISAGTIDLANASSPSITVNPISANGTNLAPLQPTLTIGAIIQDANNPLTVSGGGLLQLSAQSTFSGGVNLTSGGLAFGASTTVTNGVPVSGPVGTGTLTLSGGTSIIANGSSNSAVNPINILGNITFDDANTTAYTATLGGNNLPITLPSGGVTINVNAPQMTGALGGIVSGSANITKTGLGTLAFTNNSVNYTGTVNVNSGTLLLTGPNAGTASPIGSGTAYLNGGILQLHNNGPASSSIINDGANVTIDPSQTSAYIDINNNGANTGNIFVMGYLNMQPTTLLNITGGNNYELRFTGTNLTSLNSPATFDVGTGLTLILPGGFTGTNLPTNIGPGVLSYSGSNSTTGNTTITGTQQATGAINTTSTPFGSGTVTLSNGSTLQLVPTNNPQATTASANGYTQGGLLGKFNNYSGTGYAILSANESSLLPAAQMPGQNPGDASFDNRPAVVASVANYTDSSQAYDGLLKINTAGTYYFQVGADDADELVIDGVVVQNQLASSTGGQAMASTTPVAIQLSSGVHTITWLAQNLGGNGGQYLLYGGPDTAGSGQTTTGGNPVLQPIALSNLYYSNTIANAGNGYLNAADINNSFVEGSTTQSSAVTATLDGLGTDLNTVLGNLTLAANGTTNSTTLTVNNLGGQGFIGVVNSAQISGTGVILNTNTGTLYLIGGVTDGGSGVTKTGNGTLILGGSSGTFTGPLTVSAGFLQVAASNALTSGTTSIASGATLDLNGITNVTGNISITGTGFTKFSATPAALYNSSYTTASLASSSVVTITGTSAIGGYGNIIDLGTINDGGNGWSKVGGDVLTLSGNDTSMTGALTVANGILQAGSAGGFGGGSGSISVTSGAAVDLNGQVVSATKTMTINGTGVANTIYSNTLAALYNSSSTAPASYAGGVALGAAASVGNSSYSIVTPSLTPQAGDITISGVVSGAFVLTKTGTDTLFLTNGSNSFNNFAIADGAIIFDNSGAQSVVAASDVVNPGTSLILDDTGTNVNNRLGNRGVYVAGNFTIDGNAGAATTEQVTASGSNIAIGNSSGTTGVTNATGEAVITLIANGSGSVTLNVNSSATAMLNRAVAGSTLLVRGTNLGSAPGAGVANFTGSGTSVVNTNSGQIIGTSVTTASGEVNRAIIPWALVDTSATGNGISFAAFSSANGIQALQSGDTASTWSAPTTLSSGTTNASATVTVTSSTGLVVGELVTGPNIPGGDYIQSISGNTLTLTANATGTATSNLNYSVDPNAAPTSSYTAPTGWSAVNSLTLNNSSVSIGTNSYLADDSGGILAIGNASISGSGILTGANNNNRELIFQTPNPDAGGTTTLTVSTPMYTVAGFTKAANGNMVLQAPVYSLGQTTVNGGTLQLAAGNQTLFVPFQVPASPGNVGNTTTNGQVLQVNYGATLDLDGTNQSVQNLSTANTLDLMGGTVTNTSSTTSTLHISTNGNYTWSGDISGNINFVRDNGSAYTINSPQTYTGTTTLQGGLTTLIDLGTLQGTSQIDVAHSSLQWNNTGSQAMSNRLSNGSSLIPIYLDGGAFDFLGRSGLNDVANIGALTLDSGANMIQVQSTNGSAQLNVASLTRNVGSTLTFTAGYAGASTNNGAFGQNPYVFFNTAPTLTNGIIGGWAVTIGEDLGAGGTVTQASFATYDSATGVIGLSTYNQIGYGNAGNTFGSGDNTQLRAAYTLPSGGAVANSLTIDGAAFTLSFTNPTDTLTLQSGGLLNGTDTNARTIGASQGQGNITTAAGQQELFIHNGSTSAFTVNSNIINNGSPVSLVLDGLNIPGLSMTLAGNNTYTGTTYVDGVITYWNSANNGGTGIPGNLIVSASTNNGQDAEQPGDSSVVFLANNQTAATSNVTLLGNTQLNLNGYNGTIASLTYTNSGDAYSNDGPEVQTLGTGGVGTLTVTGNISASTVGVSNPNNLANVAQTDTTPIVNGFVNLASASPSIYVDPTNVPGQIGLELNAALTTSASAINKTGTGVLGIGAQEPNSFTAGINVTAGTLAFGANNVSFPNSTIALASGTVLDTRGLTGLVGSVSGSGTIENYSLNTPGTLQLGTDNTSTTFSGQFYSPFAQGLLSVTKYGTGTMTLTGDSSFGASNNNGTLTVDAGGVYVSGSTGILGFDTTTLNSGGTLTLDSSTGAASNRLGGTTQYVTEAGTYTTYRTLNMQGGTLTVDGNASTAVTEALGQLNLTGGGTINLNAAGTAGVNVTIQNMAGQGQYTSLLLAGSNLGSTAGAGVATVTINSGGSYGVPTGGGGAAGTQDISVRPDILGENTTTSNIAFLGNIGSVLRPLLPAEMDNNITTAGSGTGATITTTNYDLFTPQSITASQTINTLTLNSNTTSGTGGVTAALVGANPWGVDGNLLSLQMKDGGVLAFAGNTGIQAGALTYGSATYDVHVMPGATLNINAVLNQSNGFVKADGGTLVLQQPYFTNNSGSGSQEFAINGGTVQLAGNSVVGPAIVPTIWNSMTLAVPSTMNLTVNNGTVDLDGGSELVNYLSSQNPAPYGGGTAASPNNVITNTGAAPVDLITATGSNTTFSGEINNTGGALSFYHQGGSGTNALTLTSPSNFSGGMYQEGGTVTLINGGAFTGASSITVNGSTFVLDNTGMSDSTSRIPAAAPIYMNGGTFQVNARQVVENENIGTVNPISGQNVFYINQDNGNSQTGSYSLTLANLVNTPASNNSVPSGGIVSFQGTTTNTTVGAAGGNPRYFLNAVNGSSTITTNNIIGPWVIANANNTSNLMGFASYSTTYGVGYLGEANFPAYATDTLLTGVVTDNINTTASTYGVTARTINTLSSISPGAATQIALNSLTDTLTLGAGGLLIDDSGNKGVTIGSGQLTASNNSTTGNALYVFQQVNTATINTPIIDNGSGSMSLVKSGAGTLVLNPLAQVDASVITSGSSSITVTSSNGLFTGEQVTGTGIPSGTSISAINGTTVTLSNNATATGANVMLTLTPNSPVNNTYGGTTIVNAGTLQLPGTAIAIPGNLVLNNGATVTQTTVGSIAPTSNVTINGAATLTLSNTGGSPTLNSITFNDNGNSTTPTLAVPGNGLNLTGNNPITSNSDNTANAPTISGNAIYLSGSNPVITVNPITSAGQFAESLQITSNVYVSGNNLTIAGTGTLVLSNSNNLNNVTWNSGTIVVGNNSALGYGSINIGGPVGLMGYTTTSPGFSVGNTFNLTGPTASLTFVGESNNGSGGYDQLNLTGTINVTGNPTIAVSSAILTDTLSGGVSSTDSLGFTKSGPGTLVLSASDSFTGQLTIQQGMVTLSNGSAISQNNPVTISSNAGLNLNGNSLNIATLADGTGGSGGVLTNGSSSTAVTLTIGPTDSSTPTTSFSGAIVNDTSSHPLSVVKNGGSTQAFAGPNTYAGGTTINGGVLLANTPIALGSSTGTGTVTVASGGALAGGSAAVPGNIATGASTNAVNLSSGAVISAGNGITASNTTGFLNTTGGATSGYTHVWNGGASYNWKLNTNSPTGAMTPATTTTPGTTDPGGAGANWDMLSMQTLNLVASPTNQFTVNVIPLASSTTFNPNQSYEWTIADVKNANGIYLNGSNTAATLGTNYANLLASMTLNVPSSMTSSAVAPFNLGVVPDGGSGEDLVVTYSGAPEPTSMMLLGLGAGGMLLRRRRRSKARKAE